MVRSSKVVLAGAGVGVLALVIAYSAAVPEPIATVASTLVLIALAMLATGGVVGFLFGIPRSTRSKLDDGSQANEQAYVPNTNLEEISDWLTKILVGIGLIQLTRLPQPIGQFVSSVSADITSDASGSAVVGSVMATFGLGGFVIGYVVTRTQLGEAFTRADQEMLRRVAKNAAIEAIDEQERNDEIALRAVARQIDPSPGAERDLTRSDLRSALGRASPTARSHVFSMARTARHDASRRGDRDTISRTTPVFAALAEMEPNSHRNHGQLGYALKEQDQPELAAAIACLSTAINLRDSAGDDGYLYYELNRAAAWIEQLGDEQPSDSQRHMIESDLAKAATNARTRMDIADDSRLEQWLVQDGAR